MSDCAHKTLSWTIASLVSILVITEVQAKPMPSDASIVNIVDRYDTSDIEKLIEGSSHPNDLEMEISDQRSLRSNECPKKNDAYYDNCYGVRIYVDGARYEGEFVENLPNGYGFGSPSPGTYYRGYHKEGFPDGWGFFEYDNGVTYLGNFKAGIRSGMGILTWANGAQFAGEFQDGLPQGVGVYIFADGNKFAGEYLDGKRSGFGTWYDPQGAVTPGSWLDDELVDEHQKR